MKVAVANQRTKRTHLCVGAFDERIHQDHYQDGDGDPEVPNDSTKLQADKGTSCVHILSPTCLPLHPTFTKNSAHPERSNKNEEPVSIFTPAIPDFLLPLAPPRLSLPFSLSQELSIPGSLLLDLGA